MGGGARFRRNDGMWRPVQRWPFPRKPPTAPDRPGVGQGTWGSLARGPGARDDPRLGLVSGKEHGEVSRGCVFHPRHSRESGNPREPVHCGRFHTFGNPLLEFPPRRGGDPAPWIARGHHDDAISSARWQAASPSATDRSTGCSAWQRSMLQGQRRARAQPRDGRSSGTPSRRKPSSSPNARE